MPNENERDTPSTKPDGQSLPGSPMAPLTPQQDKMGKSSKNPPGDEESATIKLEKDIRSGELWLIGISAASVVLNAVIALIYYGQLRQMRKATDIATKQIILAKRVAQVAYGAPYLIPRSDYGPYLFNLRKNEKVRILFHLQNDGEREGKHISVLLYADFLQNRPSNKIPKADFTKTGPDPLSPIKHAKPELRYASIDHWMNDAISDEQYAAYKSGKTKLYIWGWFKYSDFTDDETTDEFCMYTLAKDTNGTFAETGKFPDGYAGPHHKCDESQ
jgi:hypothetical protein